jgi:CYTH domain-containing protein
MATEIERKFLLADDGWKPLADAGVVIRQGYLNTS